VPHASWFAATEISCVARGTNLQKKGICSAIYTVFGSRSSILIVHVFFHHIIFIICKNWLWFKGFLG